MEMPDPCPSLLDPTPTLSTLPRDPGGRSVGQTPHFKPSLAACVSPFLTQGQLGCRPPPIPVSLSISVSPLSGLTLFFLYPVPGAVQSAP